MLLQGDGAESVGWLLIAASAVFAGLWFAVRGRPNRTDHGRANSALASGASRAWRSMLSLLPGQRARAAAASSNELLASLAHDLRSPMQGVLGGAEQLARDEQNPERQRTLDDIRRSALHLIHIADDSLELARLNHQQDGIESRPFRLETVLADILATARPLCAADVELVVDLNQLDHGEFEGEPDRLRQILANVVHNSLARTRTGHVMITARSKPRQLDIDVQDTGPGIPEREQFKVVAAFRQGNTATGRAGMGLAIAERLATLLGGRLMLLSQSGEGCRFRLQLPFRALPEPRPRGEAELQVGFADASTLERQILLRLIGSWNMLVHEFDTRDDLARWLRQPFSLDALIVSQGWFNPLDLDGSLQALCRRQHIALVVLADADSSSPPGQGQVPADFWPRPLLPSELLTALRLRPQPRQPTDAGTPRVLIVDDHPLVRKLLAEASAHLGATAILAESGVAAVRAAGLGGQIDIVLLDRNMPGLDGLHAARALRRQPGTAAATLILMVNDAQDANDADRAAVDHVFVRPQGLTAIERKLRPLFESARPAARIHRSPQPLPSRLLEDSLLEDLDALARHLDAADAQGVADQIHRLRGALRVFPAPRHQAWLEALASAHSHWRGADPPPALKAALLHAQTALRS